MITVSSLTLAIIGAFGFSYIEPTLENGETKVDTAIVSVLSMTGRGTGFFIEKEGTKYLVTAAHVCTSSPILLSARGIHRVLLSRPDKDICISTTFQGVETLTLGADVKPGDNIYMTGFPGNLTYDYQKGTARDVGVSDFLLPHHFYSAEAACPPLSLSLEKEWRGYITTIELAILARPGNSGGPVQNDAGEVVGILIGTNFKYGYMTPVSELTGLLNGKP